MNRRALPQRHRRRSMRDSPFVQAASLVGLILASVGMAALVLWLYVGGLS